MADGPEVRERDRGVASASCSSLKEVKMPKLRHGHAPGYVRETFDAAIYAFCEWGDGDPEPTVTYEINYVPHEIPLTRACGLVWNCTDIIRGSLFDQLAEHLECQSLEPRRRTYGACAQAMLAAIKEQPK
jgi:hypothetical protein